MSSGFNNISKWPLKVYYFRIPFLIEVNELSIDRVTPGFEDATLSTRSFILIPGRGHLAGFWRGSIRLWLWQLPQSMLCGGEVNNPGEGPRALQNHLAGLHLTSSSQLMQPLDTIRPFAPHFPTLSLGLNSTSRFLNPFHFLQEFRSLSLVQVAMFFEINGCNPSELPEPTYSLAFPKALKF